MVGGTVTQVAVPTPGGTAPHPERRRWHYDRASRRSIDDERWGRTDYRYDPLGQLLEAKRGPHHEVFDYDVTGSLRNILTEVGATPRGWTLEPGNVLTDKNGTHYDNDRCKRRTRKVEPAPTAAKRSPSTPGTSATASARCASPTAAAPSADAPTPFARRVSQGSTRPPTSTPRCCGWCHARASHRAHTTRFLYDGDVLCAELTGPPCASTCTKRGSFSAAAQVEGGEVFTVVNDHLGMPKGLIDGQGRVAWAAAHSAWGRVVEVQRRGHRRGRLAVSAAQRYGDEETGLCYTLQVFRCRGGEVVLARSARDLGGGNLLGFDGATTVHSDPSGLACTKIPGVGAAGMGRC
ncbi:MAG: RHS domain-containing protein [Polyangiaceae bacterium]